MSYDEHAGSFHEIRTESYSRRKLTNLAYILVHNEKATDKNLGDATCNKLAWWYPHSHMSSSNTGKDGILWLYSIQINCPLQQLWAKGISLTPQITKTPINPHLHIM